MRCSSGFPFAQTETGDAIPLMSDAARFSPDRALGGALMKNVKLLTALLFALVSGAAQAQNPSPPFTECAAAGLDPTCRLLIVIGANGSQTVLTDNNVSQTYDGSDDTLIGVLNLSNQPVSSIPLTGTLQLFAFDGDGICAIGTITPNPAGCPFGPTGYEGPGVSFTNISADQNSGLVVFSPAIPANGGTAYFGLENAVPSACTDTDGDGLCDDWEINGLTVYVNGQYVFVDLPSMGANPNHKDIFIQADYMQTSNYFCLPIVGCIFGHTHQLDAAALALVTTAFANAPVSNPDGTNGITLHVDCGPACIMNPKTGQTWGSLSMANVIPEQVNLGTAPGNNYNWTAFDALKTPYFIPTGRQQAFHYVVFAHNLGGLDGTSGISRGIGASDFIVSLGSWNNQTGTVMQKAGTLMHELGHNLGLQHGGSDGVNYKPNFLSIMNYLFQMNGLIVNGTQGTLDYSRFALPSLNENSLNENVGLNGGAASANYGTSYYCQGSAMSTFVAHGNNAIDWNCNGASNQASVATDINRDGALTTLTSFNDWPAVSFMGGGVGGLGLSLAPPALTVLVPESSPTIDAQVAKPLQVMVSGPGITRTFAGMSVNLPFTISNSGTQNDSYTLTPTSTVTWGNAGGVPASVSLNAGASTQVTIAVTVPAGTSVGTTGAFSLKAVSVTGSNIMDVGTASVMATAMAITTPPANGKVGTAYGPLQLTASGGAVPYTWTATGLPANIQISSGGVLSGTPTVAGPANATITVTDSTGRVSTSQAYAITVAPAATVTIADPSIPPGEVGLAYGPVNMVATGGTAPYMWGAVNLPPGLSINLNSGRISGAPTAAGQYTIGITATDSNGVSASQNFTVTIATGTRPVTIGLTPGSLPNGTVGVAYGPVNMVASGGTAPYLWSATGLPAGVAINASSGAISGVPTTAASYTPAITATDANLVTGSLNYAVTIVTAVARTQQAITFGPLANQAILTTPAALSASASSGLTVTFTSETPTICQVSGTSVTFFTVGTCSIEASQAGNAVYAPATPVTQAFAITPYGPAEVGVFRQNFAWLLDANGNRTYDGTGPGLDYFYANFIPAHTGDIPVVGDWSGSGTTKIGIYRPSTGQWFLDVNGDGVYDAGDVTYNFGGIAGDKPVVGDWSGTGTSKIGIFRSGYFWLLDYNGDGTFDAGDQAFAFGGVAGDVPVAGDWNGDGKAKVGVVRVFFPGGTPAFWILDANNDHSIGAGDLVFAFGGITGDVPVVGDWNGTGYAKAGMFRSGFFWVVDNNGSAPTVLGGNQIVAFGYGGVAGDVPITGKW